MAGIGFELRKLLRKDSLLGLVQAYAYAGVIGSGPWVLSIVGMLLIGFLSAAVVVPPILITQFQVSVTWLIASSLIVTGVVQLAFTRYISDRLFEKRDDIVLSSLNGLLLAVISVCGALGVVLAFVAFPGYDLAYRVLMLAAFVLLCGIWIVTILLSGLKRYKQILMMYALGYGLTVAAALLARPWGLNGLMFGFVVGHLVLFVGMWVIVAAGYPSEEAISFGFFDKKTRYPSLMIIGVLYNLGVWMDKFVFWLYPPTSESIIGPLRASVIYDLPVFMAYLCILPGMAVFLVRIETDFVEYYERFFDAVREGGSLDQIRHLRDEMVFTIRQGLYEILKIQGITTVLVMVLAPRVLDWIGISHLYLPLLYLDVVAASLQVVLLGLLNIFFYLDRRRVVLGLTVLLLVLNTGLSWLTLQLGAAYYGYGVALAMMITVFVAMLALESRLHRLEYETFMLQ